MKAIRQGDVLLKPAKLPADAKRIPLRPVALGERTGHHHSLMSNVMDVDVAQLVEMYEENGVTYVRALGEPGDISLVHQQHKAQVAEPATPADLKAGYDCYVYVPQVENSDWGTRQVID